MPAVMPAAIVADAIEVPTPVGLVALTITAVAVIGIGWIWRSTQPTPLASGPATTDLGGERPAIVALLTGGFDVDEEAVPATVIDLAHRGHFTIEKFGDRTILRLRQHVTDDRQLATYERRVLDHIRRHAVDGVTPAEVLTLGDRGVSERWFRAFAREVTADAREQGLCRRRWGLRQLAVVWGLVIASFAGPLLAGALSPRTTSPLGWGALGNVLSGIALVGALGVTWLARNATTGNAQVDTATGRDAATRWLGVRNYYRSQGEFRSKEAASVAIWDDHLAYATAMGLARQVERELPFQAESDTRAWSNVTGQWRKVKVAYWSPLPFWGQHPGRVLFSGLVQGALAAFVASLAFQVANDASVVTESLTLDDDQQAMVSIGAMVVAIVCGALVAYGVGKVVIGVADLFRRRTVEGVVLRRRSYAEGIDKYTEKVERRFRLPFRINLGRSDAQYGARRTQRNRFVAIDDGTRDRIRALRVVERTYAKYTGDADKQRHGLCVVRHAPPHPCSRSSVARISA